MDRVVIGASSLSMLEPGVPFIDVRAYAAGEEEPAAACGLAATKKPGAIAN